MKHTALCATTVCGLIGAAPAAAGGIERHAPSTHILFEEGRHAELGFFHVSPEFEGTSGPGAPTGNITERFLSFGAAFKTDLNERLSLAFTLSEPWGTDTRYSGPVPYTGTFAELSSRELSGIVAFDATESVTVYAGLRLEQVSASAELPFVGGYSIVTETGHDFGWMAGAAYQIPEIALRVALTYYSAIEHELASVEFGSLSDTVAFETPESVALEFQTGISPEVLLFGSVRWVSWTDFVLEPPNYPLTTLVAYEEDLVNYSLGLARRFNDSWAGYLKFSYEPPYGTTFVTLGPADGRSSVALGAIHTRGDMKMTTGVSYYSLSGGTNPLGTTYEDGNAIVAGMRIGWDF